MQNIWISEKWKSKHKLALINDSKYVDLCACFFYIYKELQTLWKLICLSWNILLTFIVNLVSLLLQMFGINTTLVLQSDAAKRDFSTSLQSKFTTKSARWQKFHFPFEVAKEEFCFQNYLHNCLTNDYAH